MLERNRGRVSNLTGLEIWLFIVGRVLLGLGLGILAMTYVPDLACRFGWPLTVSGVMALAFAARGLLRKPDESVPRE